jgi:hypothetical protein
VVYVQLQFPAAGRRDKIDARGLYRSSETLEQAVFSIGVTNNMAGVPAATSSGLARTNSKRRIVIIEFPCSFVKVDWDMDKFKLENPGRKGYHIAREGIEREMLAHPATMQGTVNGWMVEGAMLWYQAGSLGVLTPEAVKRATAAYWEVALGGDLLQEFIDKHCKVAEGLWVTTEYFTEQFNRFLIKETNQS